MIYAQHKPGVRHTISIASRIFLGKEGEGGVGLFHCNREMYISIQILAARLIVIVLLSQDYCGGEREALLV